MENFRTWDSAFALACPFLDRGLHLAGEWSVWEAPALLSGQGRFRTFLAERVRLGNPATGPWLGSNLALFPGLLYRPVACTGNYLGMLETTEPESQV